MLSRWASFSRVGGRWPRPMAQGLAGGGDLAVTLLEKGAGADGEAKAAVGVAYLQDGAGFGVALRDQQFEALAVAFCGFDYGQQGDGAGLDAHLDGEAAADLAVEDLQRADLGAAFGDGGVAGGGVAPQDGVVAEA